MFDVRKTVIALVGAGVLGLAQPAWSADAEPPPNPHSVELARRLFADMHMDRMMGDMMKNMAPAMVEQMRKTNPALTEADAKAVSEVATESTTTMMTKIMDRMVPLYASTFTEKELQDVVAFYEGPSGQAMLAKMPVLMTKMTPVMIELMPEMQADMHKRLCARIKCPATPSTPPGN
jgi:hypothetical protein